MINPKKMFAVITGASSGIGFELAKQFVQNGFDVLITAKGPGLNEAALLLKDFGTAVNSFAVDLSTYEGVEKLYQKILQIGQPVSAIAINAGIGVSGDFARETNLQEELKMIQLNVVSTVHLAKCVLKDMILQGHGRVLFTSSIAGTMPTPLKAVYGASKAFILSFSESLRDELEDTGVSITALLPYPTDTNFYHQLGMEGSQINVGKKVDPAEIAKQGFEAMMSGQEQVIAGGLVSQTSNPDVIVKLNGKNGIEDSLVSIGNLK